jgi:hypothetical protein
MNESEKKTGDELRDDMDHLFLKSKQKDLIPTRILLDFELYLMDFLEKKHMLTPKSDDPGLAAYQT